MMDDWRPIKTAPKDGTRVLLVVKERTTQGLEDRVAIGWFSLAPPMWIYGGFDREPAFWQPLPDLPPREVAV